MATISRAELFATLPPLEGESLRETIQAGFRASGQKLVVLDDDPTGTQTVYDIPVLTEWSVPTLRREFENDLSCFYLLTNSRSLGVESAASLNREIATNLVEAAGERGFRVVSRSDSTLRGHFPLETDVLGEVLGPFDGVLLVPYFEAGGRYTIGDTHYVAEGESLHPAAETPFAQDATFGYSHSNLKEWVEEKTGGRIRSSEVESFTIPQIRNDGVAGVTAGLERLSDGTVCVVNAAVPGDLDVVMVALEKAEAKGKKFLFRTGAEFVASRLGLADRGFWRPKATGKKTGGLVIVGSHVPKSTMQLDYILQQGNLKAIELEVEALLADEQNLVAALVSNVVEQLQAGVDVVVYSSRNLVLGADPDSSLAVARRVSEALVSIVQQLSVSPSFLIAKGGITSSDVATRGLGVRRATVLGPLLPGVPVWETGSETRFPELPYVVFPGNVGDESALLDAVKLFQDCRS